VCWACHDVWVWVCMHECVLHMYVCVWVCMHECVLDMYVRVWVFMHECVGHVCMCVSVYARVCVGPLCMCVSLYAQFTSTHTHRHHICDALNSMNHAFNSMNHAFPHGCNIGSIEVLAQSYTILLWHTYTHAREHTTHTTHLRCIQLHKLSPHICKNGSDTIIYYTIVTYLHTWHTITHTPHTCDAFSSINSAHMAAKTAALKFWLNHILYHCAHETQSHTITHTPHTCDAFSSINPAHMAAKTAALKFSLEL
jgi:hypothetical protein